MVYLSIKYNLLIRASLLFEHVFKKISYFIEVLKMINDQKKPKVGLRTESIGYQL